MSVIRPADIARFLGAFGIFLAGLFFAAYVHENDYAAEAVRSFGILGVFAVGFVSGFNLVVPVPAAAFMPSFLASGLAFWPTVLAMTAGMAAADSVAWFIGAYARRLVEHKESVRAMLAKIRGARRHFRAAPYLLLALWAFIIPLPNELVVIPLAFLGYRLAHLLPILLAGSLVFNILFAKGSLAFLG